MDVSFDNPLTDCSEEKSSEVAESLSHTSFTTREMIFSLWWWCTSSAQTLLAKQQSPRSVGGDLRVGYFPWRHMETWEKSLKEMKNSLKSACSQGSASEEHKELQNPHDLPGLRKLV